MDRLRDSLSPGYCRRAAELLLDNKGVVLIGTGFPVSGTFESDGPIGAIALYQVLTHLEFEPYLACAPPIAHTLARAYTTCELPLGDWDVSRAAIQRCLDSLKPSLVVSIERPGMTENGRYYNMLLEDITDQTAKFDLFLKHCNCPSLAFGDGGNEIGMGNVRQAFSGTRVIPAVTTCDELVIATVSNWGVYGVIAELSHLLNEDLLGLFDPELIALYLLAEGCVDGITRKNEPSEDGFPIGVGVGIIAQLQETLTTHRV